MTSTISYDGGTIVPQLVLGYAASRRSRNVVHELLDSPDPAVTLRPAGRLTGVLELFFLDFATAHACELAHKTAGIFTFTDTDLPAAGMRYITTDTTDITLDDTRRRCIVSVPFQEVA
ncbi:hypothetical protein [Cryobacterium luteum]|uniref:Uncharacterized protein n=1 Tax=Cryobacterium luteum TaxID=1424661 RepID=A0A1H8ARD2_9MICO|nr:hypothetical protein [Cryobacterium luteum]TFB88613.1 hypothetical protein E3O10_12605 [Cryobacterium luteum]SEM73281.1 hypothetical protein SAMN05216281_101303 [Cryobacterium luteum]